MSISPQHLIRYGLVLLAAAAVGCSSEGNGGTEPGSISLAIDPAAATVQQGGSQAVNATLTRSGGFTGTVNLDVTGEPDGVAATVSNVQTAGAVTTATVTILVDAAVAPAVYPMVVRGTGSGVSEATQAFALTVAAAPAASYTLALSSPSLSIAQGTATPTTTVNLDRTNFTGNVTLSVENLPTGVTAAFNPASPISGNSSVLTLTVAASAPTGTFSNLLVRGAAAGLTDRTAPLSLTITAAPGGSGNVTVSFASCSAGEKAVWLAFRDGTSGAWTAVTGVADVFQFNITQSKGSVAFVRHEGATTVIYVQHLTQAELTADAGMNFCVTPNTRVVNGTMANLPAGHRGQVSFGGGFEGEPADGAFELEGAMTGTFDLIGFSHSLTGAGGDRAFVKRNENPAPGGNFSVPVDFSHVMLSSAAATATATLQGLGGGETATHEMNLFTGGVACVPGFLYGSAPAAASFDVSGVPASLRVGTDMHRIFIVAGSSATSARYLSENFPDIVTRAATPFVLPAGLPTPVVTDAGGPYKRPSIAISGVPAELDAIHVMLYVSQFLPGRAGFITASQGWVGGSNLTLVLPNFSGVGGFDNAWAPATDAELAWNVSSASGLFNTACAAGQRTVAADRSGTL